MGFAILAPILFSDDRILVGSCRLWALKCSNRGCSVG